MTVDPLRDWRQVAIIKFAKRMMTNCNNCPICGAMVCSDNDRVTHQTYHQTLNDKFDQAQSAIQSLRNRMTAAETAIADLQTRVTALEARP